MSDADKTNGGAGQQPSSPPGESGKPARKDVDSSQMETSDAATRPSSPPKEKKPPAAPIQPPLSVKDRSGLPKPSPHEPSTILRPVEEPISDETISIKRSAFRDDRKRIEIPGEAKKEAPPPEKKKEEARICKISCYNCGQKLDLTDLEPFSTIECPSCSVNIIVPQWFDNYLLEEPGGEGGMATVYRALDLTLDREVAIKVLNKEMSSELEKSKLFLHEARTAATLNHYAVLPIYTCGEFKGQPYIVMQFMEGGSLDKQLQLANGRLPINDVARWIRDIAEGLDNARRHGIIHHDVKPANIMLDRDGNVKIGDFGIAQAMHNSRSKDVDAITRLWSSPHFVSPEKVVAGKEDHLGDIYSLGATFYNLITGRTPFENENIKELVKFKLANDPPDPRKYRPEIPEQLSSLILAMMSRSTELRPNYRDIINTLTKFLRLKEKPFPETADAKAQKKKTSSKVPMAERKPGTAPPPASGAPIGGLYSPQQTKSSNTLLYACMGIFIVCALLFLWSTGQFGRGEQKPQKTFLNDCLPELTERLRNGNVKNVVISAQRIVADSSADIEQRKQAGIQLAFAAYLDNAPDAKNVCALAFQQLYAAGVEETNPLLATINFLSGTSIPPESLYILMGDDIDLKLIAAMATYLRSLYNKAPASETAKYSRTLSTTSSVIDPSFWANAWKRRIPSWIEWVERGTQPAITLEPLIAANKFEPGAAVNVQRPPQNTQQNQENGQNLEWAMPPDVEDGPGTAAANLTELSTEWLAKRRAPIEARRPRPQNFEFSEAVSKKYISSLPESLSQIEKARLQQVSGAKDFLCSLMMRVHYNGKVTLKDGKTYANCTVMGNRNYLSIRTKSGQQQRIEWSQLGLGQLCTLLEFYANMRIQTDAGPEVKESDKLREGAMDLLRIGIICDWYGDYARAVEYTHKAVNADSRISGQAKKYIMY